jgi:hypothetical protein
MKKRVMYLPLLMLSLILLAFTFPSTHSSKTVNFKVRGNSKFDVELGVGYQVGSGSCCRGVSKESTVGFQGEPGDKLYDSKTRKVITKITADMEGETIDLREYY